MFKITDLTVKTGEKKILDNFNLSVGDGEIHVIMGKNGIGKSTLCKVVLNDNNYTVCGGSIVYHDRNLLEMETSQIAREGICLVSQSPLAIEGVTNAQMLRSALSEQRGENINIFEFNKELEKACEKICLDKSFIHKDINVGASGGERKKIEMLHIALLKPSFIFLDEVDSGLDVDALKDVCNFLKAYHAETKCSMVIITHHTSIIDYIKPNYVHVLDNGKIVRSGDHHLAEAIENEGFVGANIIDKSDDGE